MALTVFLSWQSDTPNGIGRTLIEGCLRRALDQIRSDAEIEAAVRDLAVDRDTRGSAGSPGIVDTIFGKIEKAAVFVSDMTYVAKRRNRDGIPNPNVCIEHGWALRAIGPSRVISVLNTAFGHPDKHALPFDLRHVVGPIFYHCPPDADEAVRKQARDGLARELARRLTDVLNDAGVLEALRPQPPQEDTRTADAQAAITAMDFERLRGDVPELVQTPRLALRLAPLAAAEGRRLDPRRVAQVQLGFPLSFDDRVDNGSDHRQWWTCALPRHPPAPGLRPETGWCVRLVKPGNLEFQASLGKIPPGDNCLLYNGYQLEARVVRTLEHLARIAAELGFDGPAVAAVSFEGIEGLELTMSRGGGRPIRERDLPFPFTVLDDLTAPAAPALQDIFDTLWQASGWRNGSPSFDQGEWEGYRNTRLYSAE